MALNIKTLTTRTLTAAVFVAVLLTCINLSFLSFAGLFFMVSLWGLYEFYQLAEKLGAQPYRWPGYICGVFVFGAGILANMNNSDFLGDPVLILKIHKLAKVFWLLALLTGFGFFVRALFGKEQNPVLNIAYTLTGVVYAVLPFTMLTYATCIQKAFASIHIVPAIGPLIAPYNPHIILGVILLIWVSDSGAYLVGSLVGKHKLYERISPGKTWEGSIGGALITMGCSYVIASWYPEIAFKHWIVIALMVCVFGTIGDLIESMLKRQAGVKDSGRIMPGHGGILDRFDSLLFVSPFVCAYLYVIQ
ncbi:MAG: phosphatidate cytidylyltransferase [Bacteroidetes bacterium]|nr:phosphatidate cytidylyltransferase [Bacteroidota bacterium]